MYQAPQTQTITNGGLTITSQVEPETTSRYAPIDAIISRGVPSRELKFQEEITVKRDEKEN